jgi:hypothetical protein
VTRAGDGRERRGIEHLVRLSHPVGPSAELLELPHSDVRDRSVKTSSLGPGAVDRVLADQVTHVVQARTAQAYPPPVALEPERAVVVPHVDDEPGIATGRPKTDACGLENHDAPLGTVARELAGRRQPREPSPHDDAVGSLLRVNPPRWSRGGKHRIPTARPIVVRKFSRAHVYNLPPNRRGGRRRERL